MVNVQLGPAEILTVIAMSAALVTGLWHAAMYVGRLTVKIENVNSHLERHESRLDDHDDELRFIKGLR